MATRNRLAGADHLAPWTVIDEPVTAEPVLQACSDGIRRGPLWPARTGCVIHSLCVVMKHVFYSKYLAATNHPRGKPVTCAFGRGSTSSAKPVPAAFSWAAKSGVQAAFQVPIRCVHSNTRK